MKLYSITNLCLKTILIM